MEKKERKYSCKNVLLPLLIVIFMGLFNMNRMSKVIKPYFVTLNDKDDKMIPLHRHHNHNETIEATATSSWSTMAETILPKIEELTQTSSYYNCSDGLIRVRDKHLSTKLTHEGRKIPKVIHMTAKSRCVTPAANKIIEGRWKLFPNHSFYFHDDAAVDRLLYFNHTGTSTDIVPNYRQTLSCITNGATKSDIWRYLISYHYGGIYTDIDNEPTSEFHANTISPTDDAFFVIEALGIMAQFFFASSPKHPLMIHTLQNAISRLRTTVNVMVNNPAGTTGPGALKNGFLSFQRTIGIETNGYIDAGLYKGGGSNSSSVVVRNCTVIGDKNKPRQYIMRDGLKKRDKRNLYKQANMTTHIGLNKNFPREGKISCMQHIQEQEKIYNGTMYEVANYKFKNGTYIKA